MERATKITIGVLAVLGVSAITGGAIWYYKNKNGGGEGSSEAENFVLLGANLGVGITPNKDNIYVVKFNSGNNSAQFYNNGRVIIFNKANQILVRGKYSDGGKTIILDSGRNITSGSVWQNLTQTIK